MARSVRRPAPFCGRRRRAACYPPSLLSSIWYTPRNGSAGLHRFPFSWFCSLLQLPNAAAAAASSPAGPRGAGERGGGGVFGRRKVRRRPPHPAAGEAPPRTAAGEAPALGVIPTHGTEAALEGGGVPGVLRRQGRRPPRPTAGEAALEGGRVPGHRRAPRLESVEDAPEEHQEAAGRPRGRQGVGVHRHRGPRRQHQLKELVFEMLKEQPFYHPKEGTYMKLIVLLGRSGHAAQARQLFDEMLQQGCQPTPELYTALIGAYCRCGLLDESLQLLTDMKASPLCQPDVYTYSTIIKACVDASRFDLVEAMYKDMAERSISPNTVMQNIVLSGYGKAGRLDDMERMLSNMLDSTTCKPDVWTMNIILSLFGNRGQVEAMEEWYEKFRSYGIEPETRTLNILIGAYGKKRMYDKMSAVMEYMRKLAFPWTTATYNNVIEAFAEAGDAKNMEHTFNQMRSEGMKPDTKTFCCLINGFSKAGFFHKVVGMDKLAERLGVPTDTSFHNAILGACAKADDLMEMERVFMHMKHKQCDPDAMTYSILVEAYRKEGMTDKIYALHQENPTLVPTDLVMV
ncbi:hypothetical protein PVAP13_J086950 [Panicum virgatum]|nr:hypothetical protein PVAP13_J086950 [Panicum virgatum]